MRESVQLTGKYPNDFPVTGNRYLMITKDIDGDSYARIVFPVEIFDIWDMRDCYDDNSVYEIYLIRTDGKQPTRCEVFGTWHNFGDPLRMEIRTSRGKVLDVGYGTDH